MRAVFCFFVNFSSRLAYNKPNWSAHNSCCGDVAIIMVECCVRNLTVHTCYGWLQNARGLFWNAFVSGMGWWVRRWQIVIGHSDSSFHLSLSKLEGNPHLINCIIFIHSKWMVGRKNSWMHLQHVWQIHHVCPILSLYLYSAHTYVCVYWHFFLYSYILIT